MVALCIRCAYVVHTMASTVDWESIRRLAEQGVPFRKLAESNGLQITTLYTRSSREGWLTPEKTQLKISELIKAREEQRALESPKGGADAKNSDLAVIADTWEARSHEIRHLAYDVASRAIREAKGRIVVESASDLSHAVKVARQATGLLDEKAPTINVGIFQAAEDLTSGGMPCYEAEVIPDSMADPYEL